MIMFDVDDFYQRKEEYKNKMAVENTYVQVKFDSASINKGKLIDKRHIC